MRITLTEGLIVAAIVAILGLVGWAAYTESTKPACLEYGPRHLVMIPQKVGNVTTMQQIWIRDCVRRAEETGDE